MNGNGRIDKDADFEKVVRCKDCKHMAKTSDGSRHCFVWGTINGCGDDDFCSCGEAKEGDNDG